jgi:hypothetical protein
MTQAFNLSQLANNINSSGQLNSSNGLAGAVPVANGGTGLTSTPANGQLNIGNGTGFTRATITAGSGITVTNGAGSITINNTSISPITTTTGSAPYYAGRAWVNFNGTGTVAIRASGNVSSVNDNGTGNYTVNFTTAMPDANYSAVGTARDPEGENTPMVFTPERDDTYSTTQFQFHTRSGAGSLVDVPTVSVVVFR